MLVSTVTSSALNPSIFDINGLTTLKRQAGASDPAALKLAAQQFEALFLQMVLKSMRDATPRGGLFDSDQTRLYESLLDQQLAQTLAESRNGTGLAALIERQLTRQAGADPQAYPEGIPLPSLPAGVWIEPQDVARNGKGSAGEREQASPPDAKTFVASVWPHALEVARATGIAPSFVVAQAALESGWGSVEPRLPDGRRSYNLFGIKAGQGWAGDTVDVATTEYINGQPVRQVERFRAYASYAEAFGDYSRLLTGNPRYAGVLGATDATEFAQAMQRSGYATDPTYGAKLRRIISGQTLRSALLA